MGPLPPHSADCCHLAKLIGTKKGAKKNNRKNKKIDCAAAATTLQPQSLPLLHASATVNSSSPAATVAESENQLDDQKRLADVSEEMAKKLQNEELKIQKRLLKIQKQLEVQRPIPPPSSQTQTGDGGGGGGSGNSCNNNSTSRDTNKKSGTSAMFFSSSISTRGDARSMLTIKTAETIEKKLHRRNLMKDFVPNLNGGK